MPNGGPDCCGNCGFNKAVQVMAHPHPDKREQFWELSQCTLRNIRITNPFWTYCCNFRYGKELPQPGDPERPDGWVFASGLYEGYVRIPWHGDHEPNVSTPCVCALCGRQTNKGITVQHADAALGFCTNRHYIEWWKTQHDDPSISSEEFDTPEIFYKASP